MEKVDFELIVIGVVGLVFAVKLFFACQQQRSIPTTGEGWIEEIKRDRH